MKAYSTIRRAASAEIEEKKSVFIADIMPVKTEADAIAFINSVKSNYPDAKHHVYAYLLRDNSSMRYSDDHEPQGTAGLPVLDVLRKRAVYDAVIVVTRYFGGILLGTGGLVRAYTASAQAALELAEVVTVQPFCEYSLTCSYSDYERLSKLLSDFGAKTVDTVYTDTVEILYNVKKDDSAELEKKVEDVSGARAKTVKKGEKYDFS